MKANDAQIPVAVYDWIRDYGFAELNAAQQAEVLKFMTMEEYEDLHQASEDIQRLTTVPPVPNRDQIKNTLLARFDTRHPSARHSRTVAIPALQIWRAAAIFLCFVSGALGFSLMGEMNTSTSQKLVADTVFITRESEPVVQKIFDTVFIVREVQREPRPTPPAGVRMHIPHQDGLHVVSLDELESPANTPKGNSIQDDSLVRRYAFVTL